MNDIKRLPVAIIGGGPVGLAAAAHLAERKIGFVLIEAGLQIAANIRQWAHVKIFSPWQYNLDLVAQRLLSQNGWLAPDPERLPTGAELLKEYLEPLADVPEIRKNLMLGTTVKSIAREGLDKMKSAGRESAPFVIYARQESSCCTKNIRLKARAVIDTSGTWQNPNPMGSNGLPADGELEAGNQIFYGIPEVKGKDHKRFARAAVAVVGNGHSAIQVLLDLAQLDESDKPTNIFWVMRSTKFSGAYGDKINDALPARGALNGAVARLIDDGEVILKTDFHVQEVQNRGDQLTLISENSQNVIDRIEHLDQIVVATGSRPNLDMLRELRLDIDPALESVAAIGPLIDPNLHSCGTVPPHGERDLRQPEPGFYIAGIKSYGRAPTFLMATGYEQVRSIVAALAGDREAADNVQLSLPPTGVCKSDQENPEGACCGADTRVHSNTMEAVKPEVLEKEAACCTVEVETTVDGNTGSCCS